MDFKKKLGTIDAHNVNLNFKADNSDSHNIILNFEHLSDGSTNLNFGNDVSAVIDTVLKPEFKFEILAIYAESGSNTAVIDAVLDTQFSFDLVALYSENTDVVGQIDSVLDTNFSFEIAAEFIENLCTIDTVLDTEFIFDINALFNINHIVGVCFSLNDVFKKASTILNVTLTPWNKPILRVSNGALFFDQGLVISEQVVIHYEQAASLNKAVQAIHEEATGLYQCVRLSHESGDLRIHASRFVHDIALRKRHNRETEWQSMIRLRRNLTYSHEAAKALQNSFVFEWDKGLELITLDRFSWDEATSIHYIKHDIQPWPKPGGSQYEGTGDLSFICLCHNIDAHNVDLNFGQEDCIPAIPNRNWWYIVNDVSVTRLDTGESIKVLNGSHSTSRDSWCYSYSVTVPLSEMNKLKPADSNPVVLKIMVNGIEHHMLVEDQSETRKFAEHTFILSGRSRTALNSSDYAITRSFLQENDRTSVQLCQFELDRALSDTILNWQLIDDRGWAVPTESLSYTNLAPIDAIKLVAEAGGGFIQSAKSGNEIIIKTKYKKSFWDPMIASDYDKLLPESLVEVHEIKRTELFNYNGITLINPKSALSATIKRAGTAGEVSLDAVSNPLFEAVSMGSFGKAALSRSGLVEDHSFKTIISSDFEECAPGETLAFNAEFWGIVDSVRVDWSYASVYQTVGVEVCNREST